ncbi:MAG: ATP synthase subunit I [Anaeromicrobium sp.]|uniref:ATP synthase subunit I n=1 Tax=Anaeromicrobium sp. TaxID=1929132 RepID=UPI0025DB4406|nr:ATP synthase subunit I [Anaeromicrobium sp.]MCT4592767.1 ATP synthase subunit I [Anaeromicrobium sp.]
MSFTRDLQLKTYKYTILSAFVIGTIATILFDNSKPIIMALIFGTIIGILNFRLLAMTLEKASQMEPRQAQVYVTSRYFVRYIITGLVLYVAIKAEYLNVIGVIIGLVLIKIVILSTNLFNDKAYYMRIFGRKEDK